MLNVMNVQDLLVCILSDLRVYLYMEWDKSNPELLRQLLRKQTRCNGVGSDYSIR